MLFNKYNKIRSRDNWDKYRTQRNLVNKIKRKSIREYFIERCVGGSKQKDFGFSQYMCNSVEVVKNM
jgi:hypothetical protein